MKKESQKMFVYIWAYFEVIYVSLWRYVSVIAHHGRSSQYFYFYCKCSKTHSLAPRRNNSREMGVAVAQLAPRDPKTNSKPKVTNDCHPNQVVTSPRIDPLRTLQ
jgi:hypothetical protein